MSARRTITLLLGACALAAPSAAAMAPSTSAAASVGTREQISWVRSSASRFVGDELRGDGAGACSILYAPLTASEHHRTCAQRWDAKLARQRHESAARAQLHADAAAIASATVIVHGNDASITLPAPLMGAPANTFLWTSNCWMLTG
jgi:hypothetical protein